MEGTGFGSPPTTGSSSPARTGPRVGLLAAVGLHFGLVVLVQPFEAADMGSVVNEIEAIRLPPEVPFPPPPEAIARPATPRGRRRRGPRRLVIPPTTFDQPRSEVALLLQPTAERPTVRRSSPSTPIPSC